MPTLKEQIVELLARKPGLTDREVTNLLMGVTAPQQSVNLACRNLEQHGVIERSKAGGGLIRNSLRPTAESALPSVPAPQPPTVSSVDGEALSEDQVKAVLAAWLEEDGWSVAVAYGYERGIDIEAKKGDQRWLIEVKGPGKYDPMRENYFRAILGQTLLQMNDPNARYSIAFPDLGKFRRLWAKLPALAKQRTTIDAIFVGFDGNVQVMAV